MQGTQLMQAGLTGQGQQRVGEDSRPWAYWFPLGEGLGRVSCWVVLETWLRYDIIRRVSLPAVTIWHTVGKDMRVREFCPCV